MRIITTILKMKAASEAFKSAGKTVGFVPTMGFLHEGHLSLVRESLKRCGATVVSIFVNPTQFGPKEDFTSYPRDVGRDRDILKKEGVDILFQPEAGEMYPEGYGTYVEVAGLQDRLCGRSRPGHFRGVATVVLKLFEIVKPDIAFFGRKDAQQAILLQRMVDDLNLDVKLAVMPTVRDADGLALSSRNAHLSSEERRAALILSAGLREAEKMIGRGERNAAAVISRIKEVIGAEPPARIDYMEIVDPRTLDSLEEILNDALIALAVFVGKTRLIDNLVVKK